MLEMTREEVVEMLEAGDLPLRLIDMVREDNEPVTDVPR